MHPTSFLLILLSLTLCSPAWCADRPDAVKTGEFTLLPGLDGVDSHVLRDRFRQAFESALVAGDAKHTTSLVRDHAPFATELINLYLCNHRELCLLENRILERSESPDRDRALVLAELHGRLSEKAAILEMARRIESWTLEEMTLWKELDNELREAWGLTNRHRFQPALEIFRSAEKKFAHLGASHDRASVLLLIIEIQSHLQRNEEALAGLKEVRTILKALNDGFLYGQCLLKEGKLCRQVNRHHRALELFDEAIVVFNSLGAKPGLVRAGRHRASALHYFSRNDEAKELLQELIRYSKSIGNDLTTCDLLGDLANVMQGEACPDLECLSLCDEGLALAEEIDSPDRRANLLWTSGKFLRSLGRQDEAIARLEEALSFYVSHGLPHIAAEIRSEKARCLVMACRLESAKETANEALAFYDAGEGRSAPANLIACLADIAVNEGEAARAREWLDRLEALAAGSGAAMEKANIFQSCCSIAMSSGDYKRALDFAESSLEAARLSRAALPEGQALGFIASVYQDLNRNRKACEYFERSRRVLNGRQDSSFALQGNNRYVACLNSLGRYDEAKRILTATLEAARAKGLAIVEGECLHLLGRDCLRRGKMDEALEAFSASLAIWERAGNSRETCREMVDIASTRLDQGNPDAALALLASPAIKEITKSFPPWRFHTLGRVGIAWRKKGEPKKALDAFDAALAVHEKTIRNLVSLPELSQGTFSGKFNWIFVNALLCCNDLFELTGESAYLDRAHAIDESRKARALLGSLSRTVIDVRPSVPLETAGALARCRHRIASLEKMIATEQTGPGLVRGEKVRSWQGSLREEEGRLEEIMGRIRMEDPAYSWLNLPEPVSIESLRPLLGDRTAWISFVFGSREGLIIAANSDRLVVRPLPDCPDLTARVRDLLSMMTDPAFRDVRRYASSARALYCDLVEPVEGVLAGRDRIIISPDGVLNLLPFGALLDDDVPPKGPLAFRDLPYLVLNRGVACVPSGTTLRFLHDRKKGREVRNDSERPLDLFATGEIPAGSCSSSLSTLPHTGRELRGIARFFDGEKVEILRGPAATEAAFRGHRIGSARIVHVATHALVKPASPYHSSIVLATGGGDDGRLRTYEIYELDLQAELVVLSACNTNIGTTLVGEGIYGFVRAFFYAGADAVVATNWEVRDRFSAAFMEDFYGKLTLKNGSLSCPDALRDAKIDAIRGVIGGRIAESDRAEAGKTAAGGGQGPRRKRRTDYAHPFYWAPFVHFGLP